VNIISPEIHSIEKEPPERKCSICKDRRGVLSGEYCRDNKKSLYYDDDLITGTDYIDCWVYIRGNETEEEHCERMKKDRGLDYYP